MGLMNKLKNILFEEEEVEIPVLEKKPKEEIKEMPKKEDKTPVFGSDSYYDDLEPTIKIEKAIEDKEIIKKEDIETPQTEKKFSFPSFDEEEFESFNPKPRETNILEKERREKIDYSIEKKQPQEEKKFRPSPIISPVYGILDKNYTPDEITARDTSEASRKLNVDDVRNKAFGLTKEKEIPKIIEDINTKDEDDLILEEKLEKARTIDELLKESSDEVITVKDEIPEADTLELTQEINDVIPNVEEDKQLEETKEIDEDDTIESDLFDLIDSMYENREGDE